MSKNRLIDKRPFPVAIVLIFVIIFAGLGSYIISTSLATTSTTLISSNLDVLHSVGASVITETTTQSKRNDQVVQLINAPIGAVNGHATFANAHLSLGVGTFSACFTALAPNVSVSGTLSIAAYSPVTGPGAIFGKGGFNLNPGSDYSSAGCFTFSNNSINTSFAAIVTSQTANSVIRIAHVDITKTSPGSL